KKEPSQEEEPLINLLKSIRGRFIRPFPHFAEFSYCAGRQVLILEKVEVFQLTVLGLHILVLTMVD
ncbi:MAG: hypothetical protein ACXWCR_13865, partial [Flavitalea sp.]